MKVRILNPLDIEAEVISADDVDVLDDDVSDIAVAFRPKCYDKRMVTQTVCVLETVDDAGNVHDLKRVVVSLKTGKISLQPKQLAREEITCFLDANIKE